MAALLDELQNREIKLITSERIKSDLALAREKYERVAMRVDQMDGEMRVLRSIGPRVSIIETKKNPSGP